MNRDIVVLTARQLLGAKRTLLLLLFALIPVGIAFIRHFSDHNINIEHWTANRLLAQLVVGTLLPLGALVFGTAALGSEIEDGTAVYLLSKPIPRWHIVASKLLVAWLATAALVIVSAVSSSAVSLDDFTYGNIVVGFAVGATLGALAYCAVFVLLSILTSRALIVGLLYVFIWEATLTRLFSGLRLFSIRMYALGIADRIITAPSQVFTAELDGIEALLLVAVVTAAAFAFAARRLAVFEIGEST